MRVLSISLIDLWPWGKNIGIPSIYASQRGLVERGHKVYFLCPQKRKDLPLKEDYEGICIRRFKLPFNISSLPAYSLPLNNIWTHLQSSLIFNLEWFFFQFYSLFWGIKIARHIKPSLIYAHSFSSVFSAYLISRLFRAKLAVRVYGTGDLYWKWQSLWYQFKEIRDYLGFKIPADYFIITKDGSHGDFLARNLGVPEDKIKCWRNGVDFGIYEPNPEFKKELLGKLNFPLSTKIIISTSRLIYLYGVDRLVSALPELFARNKNSICIIAGEGAERKGLEDFVNRCGIQSRVVFLGMADRERLKKLLNAADLFVFLPRYHSCTNTMWEAMVCGKCIVTTENEAIKEVLTSGENSILLSSDKINELPLILDELLTNDELRNRVGSNVHLRAKEVLETWPRRINKEIELLEQMVRK